MDQRSGTMTIAALEDGKPPEASTDPPPGRVPGNPGQRPDQPGPPMSRFQLRNWRVRWRIGVLVVIPTIAAIVLGGVRIESARGTAGVFARVNQLASLGSDVTSLAQSLEDERDLTAGEVAARQSGDTALAQTVSAQLNSQYTTTNDRSAAVEGMAGQIGSSYPAVARTDLSAVVTELGTLPSVRALPQTGMAALPIITVYSNVISVLLTFDNDLAAGSSSPQLAQTVGSLGDLAQLEDQASAQRAILYTELIAGQFGTGGLQALINAQAAQSSDLSAFQGVGQNLPAYAPAAGLSPTLTEVQQFNSIVSGPGIDAAEAIEQNALISGNTGQSPIQPNGGPQAWFGDMTNELGTMRAVESDILASSVAQATSLHQSSEGSEQLTAVVIVSADGLPLAYSAGFPQERADQLAAVTSGLASLTQGASRVFEGGIVVQTAVEMQAGVLVVMAVSNGASLAVLATSTADLGLIAYEMALLVERAGKMITPASRRVDHVPARGNSVFGNAVLGNGA